jgi:hypothetical protein
MGAKNPEDFYHGKTDIFDLLRDKLSHLALSFQLESISESDINQFVNFRLALLDFCYNNHIIETLKEAQ